MRNAPIQDRTVASGHWKCCVAHDISTLAEKNLVYRVTAVDTVTKSKSPAALSNTIVNWPIKTDPPVLSDSHYARWRVEAVTLAP